MAGRECLQHLAMSFPCLVEAYLNLRLHAIGVRLFPFSERPSHVDLSLKRTQNIDRMDGVFGSYVVTTPITGWASVGCEFVLLSSALN
jgi:hypothetical protein